MKLNDRRTDGVGRGSSTSQIAENKSNNTEAEDVQYEIQTNRGGNREEDETAEEEDGERVEEENVQVENVEGNREEQMVEEVRREENVEKQVAKNEIRRAPNAFPW